MLTSPWHVRLKQRAACVSVRRRSSAFKIRAAFSCGETHMFNACGGQTMVVVEVAAVLVVIVGVVVVVVVIVVLFFLFPSSF